MAFLMTISFASTCLAQGNVIYAPIPEVGQSISIPVGDAEYVDFGDGKLIPIASLLSFDSRKAADEFVKQVRLSINDNLASSPVPINMNLRSTRGDV